MRKRLQILKSRPTEPGYPHNPPGPPRIPAKSGCRGPPRLSLTIKTNRPQHALHHCKAVGGGSMTAGAVSATVPSIVLVYQLSEFREQIAEVRTYLGICGLARRHWLWTPGPPLYKAKPEILWREWCTTPVTNTVIIHLPLPPAERWQVSLLLPKGGRLMSGGRTFCQRLKTSGCR